MGLFSKILSAAEIVGGVALEFVPGGQLAGAMLITAGIGSSGLVGGSIGKFLNSNLAKGLMGAVSLGSAAVAMYGASVAQAGAEAAAQTSQAASQEMASMGNDIATTAGSDADSAITNTGMMADSQVSQQVSAIASQDPSNFAVSGTTPASAAAQNTQIMGTGPNAQASQAAAQNTNAATQAVQPQAAPGSPGAPAGSGSPTGAAASNLDTTSANPSGQPLSPGLQNPMAQPSTGGVPPPGGGGVGGMLSKGMDYIGKNPGVAVMAGNALSGMAQGAAQEKMNQQQIAAQQWGNLQWQNPAEVSQLQAAAAKPITVPQGYLARAQAVRGMMTQPVGGVQPLPAASPGAPLAPSPVHV